MLIPMIPMEKTLKSVDLKRMACVLADLESDLMCEKAKLKYLNSHNIIDTILKDMKSNGSLGDENLKTSRSSGRQC
ncbi:hypothetical protein M422DRAFT_268610 [Sphaerobolus stellatus SS14]|uniref:Uncharacterized protein n=1 Tax=Sphaerobolus stellatus (strain SS14) TaxID=990650 RepID=A0A0C9U6Q8_SPHS4|nr:hypothetical protein M422DRAFT_268610 [Sphaerobolus stellatus SS14]